jgi:hypothetical protein
MDDEDDEDTDDPTGDTEARQWIENTHKKRIMAATDIEIQFIVWNLLVSLFGHEKDSLYRT